MCLAFSMKTKVTSFFFDWFLRALFQVPLERRAFPPSPAKGLRSQALGAQELNNERIENTDKDNEYKPDTKPRKKKCLILSDIHAISFRVWVCESNGNTNN